MPFPIINQSLISDHNKNKNYDETNIKKGRNKNKYETKKVKI
jgi:hypothetical protein